MKNTRLTRAWVVSRGCRHSTIKHGVAVAVSERRPSGSGPDSAPVAAVGAGPRGSGPSDNRPIVSADAGRVRRCQAEAEALIDLRGPCSEAVPTTRLPAATEAVGGPASATARWLLPLTRSESTPAVAVLYAAKFAAAHRQAEGQAPLNVPVVGATGNGRFANHAMA